ncbi:protein NONRESPONDING TO OXYLIPINS 2, mitochondrial-like isoform X1 [Gossypium arboreum]|uniref:protein NONRESPONDING TO OXYLIPINS 2, mitochondrial-like isoform X1 n=1 Tax=Gossypium arboreum TaxID=29729 RepID=UPI0008196C90|nr:protein NONRESPONDING TO OXYLIPINS 2, mitochondrial-like isoform X1 [Gossypium arboreum]
MAGSTILSRLSSSRLKALPVKLKSSKPVLPTISPLKSSSQSQFSSASSSSSSSSVKRISGIPREMGISLSFRLPVELSCLISMMPLHSAVASARLRSFLAIESQSWGLIPQGISMPL